MVGRALGCALQARLTIPYLGVDGPIGIDHAALRRGRWRACIASRRTSAIHRWSKGDAHEDKGSVERIVAGIPRVLPTCINETSLR